MPKMSFKCKECGEKIIVKEPGVCKCDKCNSLYKCFFEVKKKSKEELVSQPIEKPAAKNAIMKFYRGHKSA